MRFSLSLSYGTVFKLIIYNASGPHFAHSSQLEIHFVEPTVSQNRNGRIIYDFLDLRLFSNIGHANPIFSKVHRYVFEELFKDANIMSL